MTQVGALWGEVPGGESSPLPDGWAGGVSQASSVSGPLEVHS